MAGDLETGPVSDRHADFDACLQLIEAILHLLLRIIRNLANLEAQIIQYPLYKGTDPRTPVKLRHMQHPDPESAHPQNNLEFLDRKFQNRPKIGLSDTREIEDINLIGLHRAIDDQTFNFFG